MSRLDIVNHLSLGRLLAALAGQGRDLPERVLEEAGIIRPGYGPGYFNWGRNALYWLFKQLDCRQVGLPSFTCPTLMTAAEQAGKKVVLLAVDKQTFNLDVQKIPKGLECLVAVHTFGNPVDLGLIKQRLPQAYIIEDCAHGLFSRINGQLVGGQGQAVLFSLYKQVVNLNGSLLMIDPQSSAELKAGKSVGSWLDQLDNRGREGDFQYFKRLLFKLAGPHQAVLDWKRKKYLPEIEARQIDQLAPSQLVFKLFSLGFKGLRERVAKKQKLGEIYREHCRRSPYFSAQRSADGCFSSYYHFAIRLNSELAACRDRLVFRLRQKNIFLGRLWYDAPVTKRRYQQYRSKCANGLSLAQQVISLPIKPEYQEKDVKKLFRELTAEIEVLRRDD